MARLYRVGPRSLFAGRPDPLWWADWSTALGNTQPALRDGSRFSAASGNNTLVQVVTNASVGFDFPTANILEVRFDATHTGVLYCEQTGMALPDVGQHRYYRWYTRVVAPNNGSGYDDAETHGIQAGSNFGACAWVGHHYTDVANEWAFRITVSQALQNDPPWGWFRSPGLSKSATYRIELDVYRDSATTIQIHARIYNIGGSLQYDDTDFVNMNGTGTLATAPSLNDNDVTSLQNIVFGANGLANVTEALTYQYIGAPCIRADDWCGAWTAGNH